MYFVWWHLWCYSILSLCNVQWDILSLIFCLSWCIFMLLMCFIKLWWMSIFVFSWNFLCLVKLFHCKDYTVKVCFIQVYTISLLFVFISLSLSSTCTHAYTYTHLCMLTFTQSFIRTCGHWKGCIFRLCILSCNYMQCCSDFLSLSQCN